MRQVIGDRFPLCLGPDKNVGGWANGRRIYERTERNVDVLAIADNGVQERAALAAANVMIVLVPETKQRCLSCSDREFSAFDARKGLVCCAGGSPTLRAVTDE